jgi:ABC-2 type transport system ATP-binding protein
MAHIDLEAVNLVYPILGESSKSLRAVIAGRISPRHKSVARVHEVRALQNVTLTLKDGDRVGLIGSNGAGKSSLLRLLAGIYRPTNGRLSRSGRVMTVFDLGYGMDEDASGYENIRIGATMLGVPKQALQALTEDIEEFSELGEALLRPIRTYSAGMRVRLAFGLASSVTADILLIDEIIGVGDARFMVRAKQRLLDRMSGAKILVLASHAEAVLLEFCTTSLVLNDGRVEFAGETAAALKFYNTGRAE